MTTNAKDREVIRFTKMHGIGNDYIYIDCMKSIPERLPELAREMSDRHIGVGGDGIVLICPSATADFRMRMFNNDGSEARMCGNASRCIARYVHDHNLSSNNPLSLETLSGIKALSLNIKEGDVVDSVTVDMGAPSLDKSEIPVEVAGDNVVEMRVETPFGPVSVTAVSMGNPHGVIFVEDLDSIPFDDLGPYMETHPMWPDRANIEFAQVLNDREIRMRVWERGTGETLACGTGACATAVAGVLTGRTCRDVTLRLRGGDLNIEWREADGHVMMTGPATEVFTGEYCRQS
ncbi:MAG: diaminopimelate epimerase [Paenibacillus sp.]|nr:diaminopimelate epimerase [Paenibacillus sp.]